MTKHIYIGLALLFCIMSTDCHYTPSGPPTPKKIPSLSDSGLTGSWRWIGSFGVGNVLPSNNFNLKIEFRDDSLFSFFRNDTLIYTANYRISLVDTESYDLLLDSVKLTKFATGIGY